MIDASVHARYLRLVGLLRCLKLLPEVLALKLVVVSELEDDKADGSLSEDEHFEILKLVGWR